MPVIVCPPYACPLQSRKENIIESRESTITIILVGTRLIFPINGYCKLCKLLLCLLQKVFYESHVWLEVGIWRSDPFHNRIKNCQSFLFFCIFFLGSVSTDKTNNQKYTMDTIYCESLVVYQWHFQETYANNTICFKR